MNLRNTSIPKLTVSKLELDVTSYEEQKAIQVALSYHDMTGEKTVSKALTVTEATEFVQQLLEQIELAEVELDVIKELQKPKLRLVTFSDEPEETT